MYFLSPVFVLSGTLAAAHDAVHDGVVSNSTPLNSTLAASTSPAGSTKTVIVTVTHTLYPPDTITPATPKTSSHFAVPPLLTHGEQLGEHGGAAGHYPTSSTASSTGLFPESKNAVNLTGILLFTLDTSSSVPFVGHYTLPTLSPLRSPCTHPLPPAESSTATPSPEVVSTSVPPSSPSLDTSLPAHTSPTHPSPPTSSEAEGTMDTLPVHLDTEGTVDIFPIPSAAPEGTTPVSRIRAESSASGFGWPSIPSSDDYIKDDSRVGSETAWAGTDNAIPTQMQGRALLWLRRVRIWRANEKNVSGEGAVAVPRERKKEMRDCKPCGEEGRVLCRGDVAIGVCRGGCEEMQFFGRGRGNGCEDD